MASKMRQIALDEHWLRVLRTMQRFLPKMSLVAQRVRFYPALEELGEDAVMFSVDYPCESANIAPEFIETANIPEEVRAKVCFSNASKLLRLEKML
ncbi:amidohydrolase family protein [Gluconacetobacter liquefaciens]|nr:amidohydrolase family protein [Gluconacetobacter liquefaciens]